MGTRGWAHMTDELRGMFTVKTRNSSGVRKKLCRAGRAGLACGVHKEKVFTVAEPGTLLPFLLTLPGLSRKDAKNLLRFKAVAVAGVAAPVHDTPLARGTQVRVSFGKHTPAGTLLPGGLEILHEDDAVMVVNKPAGLLTMATESEKARTAYAFLAAYVRERAPMRDARVYIVHRLDRETSGLLIFARTEAAQRRLQEDWKAVTKKYLAIVEGIIAPAQGTLRSALVESDTLQVHSTNPDRPDAKLAVTHYRTLRTGAGTALLELTLDTGRKNQLRVQLADAGHPIVGDDKYGAKTDPARRLALHAAELRFQHPLTGAPLHFQSPLPEKLRALLWPATSAKAKPGEG